MPILHAKRVVLSIIVLLAAAPAEQHAQRVREPRIRPLEAADWTDQHRVALGPYAPAAGSNNSLKTCVRHPDLCKSWLTFASYIEGNSSALSRRDRAVLMLRTAWLSSEDYHWGHGVRSATRAGLTDEEIRRITKGPNESGWSRLDAALLRAADELHADQFITDATWSTLAQRYGERELLDIIFTVGQYTLVSMFHNSAGTALEQGIGGLPK